MNINKLIKDTLTPLGYPVSYRKYSGQLDPYITFFEMNTLNDDYSDDIAETEGHSLQIDLFSKKDITEVKETIKLALKAVFDDVIAQDLYEETTLTYHIAFRCYYFEGVI